MSGDDDDCAELEYDHVPTTDKAVFATINGLPHINQYRIIEYISSGEEASVFKGVSIHNTREEVVILALKNPADAPERIQIHEMLNGTDGCVSLLEVIRAEYFDFSRLSEKDKNRYADIVVENKIFLVTRYFNGSACNKILRNQKSHIILQGFLRIAEIVNSMHEKNIYHFDLKPDNILCTQTLDICIIDFGAARHLDSQHLNLIDVVVPDDQPTTKVAKFTPLYAPEVNTDCDIAEKFDVYSLGCVLFDILTKEIPPDTLIRHSQTSIKLNKIFGPLITDLMNGMLEPDENLRYSLVQVLDHPCFQQRSGVSSISLLEEHHFYVVNEIRDCILEKPVATDNLRSQSVGKSRDILTFRSQKRNICDDQANLPLQAVIRKFAHIHSDYYDDEDGLINCGQFNQFTIPFTYKENIMYYYRLYTEIYNILSPNPEHEDFLRFYHMIDRMDCLSGYLVLYRDMLQNPKNVPRNVSYSKNSIANRMSRQSTYLRENFQQKKVFDDDSDSELQKRYSAIEFSVDMDGRAVQKETKRKAQKKSQQQFQIQMPFSVNDSRGSQSEQFNIPPPNQQPLLDDIFGGYQNIDIEMSTSQMQRISTFTRQSAITRRSTLNSSRPGKK